MGTHATIRFNEVSVVRDPRDDHPITHLIEAMPYEIYVHYDGYESGLGVQLADILALGTDLSPRREGRPCRELGWSFFSLGCFAATVLATIKTEPGNVYLEEFQTHDCEYEYEITLDRTCHTQEVPWLMTVHHRGDQVFSGTAVQFLRRWAPQRLANLEEAHANHAQPVHR